MERLVWRKPAGRCALHTDDACFEQAVDEETGARYVRNSTRPDSGTLTYTADEWHALRQESGYFTSYIGGDVVLTHKGVSVGFTEAEWRAFLADELMLV